MVFENTAARFAALSVPPTDLVFGHGDLHGGNLVLVDDDLGPRVAGVLDFENASILDVNYDFGRLNLIDDDLQVRVIAAYQASSGRSHPLDAARIEVYSRAFLIYLMGEQVDLDGRLPASGLPNYRKLTNMLREHVDRYESSR